MHACVHGCVYMSACSYMHSCGCVTELSASFLFSFFIFFYSFSLINAILDFSKENLHQFSLHNLGVGCLKIASNKDILMFLPFLHF